MSENREQHREQLERAIDSGDLGTLRLLLQDGANPNDRDSSGAPFLDIAAYAGRAEICSELIKAGARIDDSGDDHTPLMQAVWNGHLEVCRLLLQAGADVNASDGDRDTPLHYAAWMGHANICYLLLEHGADPRSENTDGKCPYQLAENVGLLELARQLRAYWVSAGTEKISACG